MSPVADVVVTVLIVAAAAAAALARARVAAVAVLGIVGFLMAVVYALLGGPVPPSRSFSWRR